MTLITYRGVNRNGTHVVGDAYVASVEQFVRSKFEARWQDLDVYPAGNDNNQIGRICWQDNRRVWWAEI